MNASLVLLPGASKRLIAKGVAALPSVQRALVEGRIVIALGTTNAFVAEELLRTTIDRGAYAAGFIDDRWNINRRLGEAREVVLDRGRPADLVPDEVRTGLKAGDLFIKGGNALDPWGVVGVLTAESTGGTVGRYAPIAFARGVEIVIPISLAKSVHASVVDLAGQMGIGRCDLHMGLPSGLYPLHGRVITEADALEALFSLRATHVASTGVGAGAGSVSLWIEGDEAEVRAAHALVESLRSEPDVSLQGRA